MVIATKWNGSKNLKTPNTIIGVAITITLREIKMQFITNKIGLGRKEIIEFNSLTNRKNSAYCNKIFQWSQPPRVVLMGLVGAITILSTVFYVNFSLKWWILLLLLGLAFAFGIPDRLVNDAFKKAICSVPLLNRRRIL